MQLWWTFSCTLNVNNTENIHVLSFKKSKYSDYDQSLIHLWKDIYLSVKYMSRVTHKGSLA